MSKRTFDVIKKNVPKSLIADTYHDLLTLRWSLTFLIFILVMLGINSIFATLYWLDSIGLMNSEGSWLNCFYFSVQTLGTIGYGHLSPISHYVHWLVTIEAALGTIIVAIMAGFFFAKISRPTSKVEFANKAVVSLYEGKPTFILRMVNIRDNQLLDSAMYATVLKHIKTPEGQTMRRFLDLKLVRSRVPLFSLSMTIMHVIDEESPLKEFIVGETVSPDLEILITAIGVDSTFGQTIHASQVYRARDIHLNRYFKDMLQTTPEGVRILDYSLFHDLA